MCEGDGFPVIHAPIFECDVRASRHSFMEICKKMIGWGRRLLLLVTYVQGYGNAEVALMNTNTSELFLLYRIIFFSHALVLVVPCSLFEILFYLMIYIHLKIGEKTPETCAVNVENIRKFVTDTNIASQFVSGICLGFFFFVFCSRNFLLSNLHTTTRILYVIFFLFFVSLSVEK